MLQKKSKSTPKKNIKILTPKIHHLNLEPYLPLHLPFNLPPTISIDPGPSNSALISTKPPIALQFINDTNSYNLSTTLKYLLHTHPYSLILIENFTLYSPRKHATNCLFSIGYLTAIADFFNIPYKLINKPKKNHSPIQLPPKLQHISDALNLLFYYLSRSNLIK
jgi:hypothetical protein